MSQRSNGIAAEVIREIMPPYQLGADLVQATFAALPAPPPDASAAWREPRITRLIQEILACKPAEAGQARIGAQLLIVREMVDTFAAHAHRARPAQHSPTPLWATGVPQLRNDLPASSPAPWHRAA